MKIFFWGNFFFCILCWFFYDRTSFVAGIPVTNFHRKTVFDKLKQRFLVFIWATKNPILRTISWTFRRLEAFIFHSSNTQMVRNFAPRFFRPPWPFIKKGDYGQRKIGPMTFEKHQWPGQNREFPELSPKFQKLNPEELHSMNFYFKFYCLLISYSKKRWRKWCN